MSEPMCGWLCWAVMSLRKWYQPCVCILSLSLNKELYLTADWLNDQLLWDPWTIKNNAGGGTTTTNQGFFHIHLVPANTIDIVYHKELRKHNEGEEGKENARKKVKRGWVAVLSTPFLLDLGPIFIYTYSNFSLTYYSKSFFWDLIDVTLAAEDAN